MGLEDFEKELAASKAKETRKKRDRSHHHSSRHDRGDEGDERHGQKRSRHHRETSEERARRKRRERERDADSEGRPRRKHKDDDDDDDDDRLTRKRTSRRHRVEEDAAPDDDQLEEAGTIQEEAGTIQEEAGATREEAGAIQEEAGVIQEEAGATREEAGATLERDHWMQAPSAMDVDYVQRKKKEDKSQWVRASGEMVQPHRTQETELREETPEEEAAGEFKQRDVAYTFGDAGSHWRMTKLRGIYRIAKEQGRPVEDVAMDKYGDLRDFDEAREEEIEVDRRNTYGKEYVGKEKPSGELYQERRLEAAIHRPARQPAQEDELPQGEIVPDPEPSTATVQLSQTELNRLKAQMMKAKMKGAANAAELEAQYNAAVSGGASNRGSNVVMLNAMDNRMLAGGRKGEVTELTNKRGLERGLVVENEDMSIEDMVRQERRTKGQRGGEGMLLAEKIAKDSKFDNNLDYLDENASKLATRAPKSTVNLRNTAISDYHKTNRILDSCPLCHHEEKSPPQPPVAPVVSLATRVFLTLPTEPEISSGGAIIVPIQHHTNLLECDDDEWDEMRNFMKCLTRMYAAQGRDVIFYENAAHPGRQLHAAMTAVPIPFELGDTAPAFFREAILASDAEWSQHKPIIDTLKASRNGLGKSAFRKSLAKEMPYFHVWFELDGGMAHVVEDARRWPRGDLFAREVLGGMLDVEVEVVKRQGKWVKGDRRVEGWRRSWRKFDWTDLLAE
ncbi:hypothetical protein P280DRAFT_500350 [Massarina eburnea CBS 473.64]|uniref:Cell cycle control protein cwf19 n=1 Tax=Massarina eburnea CBS 473.64 TaxID=1395130 RepID=A0A6A6RTT8_9PLEO|nr:hypothetical protein P280DRAFT_500350 [Massarina eburnea CBS 473.64]